MGLVRQALKRFYLLTLRRKVPGAPVGYANLNPPRVEYDHARVFARLGARSREGVQVAMRKRGASSVDELVEQLEHFSPRREVGRRIRGWVRWWRGDLDYDPDRARRKRAKRRGLIEPRFVELEIRERLTRTRSAFNLTEE